MVAYNVYEYIEDCASYEDAIEALKGQYVKTPNEIFARHILATARQVPGQPLKEFLQNLFSLSKECRFRAVTAEAYRKEMIRDAFINGMLSGSIRQRLLENRELSLEDAVSQANALELAQRNSQAYGVSVESGAQVMTVAEKQENSTLATVQYCKSSKSQEEKSCFFVAVFRCIIECTVQLKMFSVSSAGKRVTLREYVKANRLLKVIVMFRQQSPVITCASLNRRLRACLTRLPCLKSADKNYPRLLTLVAR